jgi:hypothetical protein
MKLKIRPLTPDLWPALEDLFGKPGARNGCWRMNWRLGPAYREQGNQANKRAFRKVVEDGPPPGLLAFDGDLAVGWCQPRGPGAASVELAPHRLSVLDGVFVVVVADCRGRIPTQSDRRVGIM